MFISGRFILLNRFITEAVPTHVCLLRAGRWVAILIDMTSTEKNGDASVIIRLQADDPLAMQEVHERYANRVLRCLLNLGMSFADAEEISQEVWLRVWQQRKQLGGNNLLRWVFTVAKNCARDQWRKQSVRTKHQPELEYRAQSQVNSVDSSFDEQQQLTARLTAQQDCLKSTDSTFIDVLRAQVLGEEVSKTANRLGISSNTVYSRRNRGKEQLRNCIEQKLK